MVTPDRTARRSVAITFVVPSHLDTGPASISSRALLEHDCLTQMARGVRTRLRENIAPGDHASTGHKGFEESGTSLRGLSQVPMGHVAWPLCAGLHRIWDGTCWPSRGEEPGVGLNTQDDAPFPRMQTLAAAERAIDIATGRVREHEGERADADLTGSESSQKLVCFLHNILPSRPHLARC